MATTLAYAAHYLQLGSWRTFMVRALCREGKVVNIEPFEQEVSRTIFLSGTIYLVSPLYPMEEGKIVNISFEQMRELVLGHGDWTLVLPSL